MSSFQERRLREMSHTLFFCSVQEAARKTPLHLMFTEEDERKELEEEEREKKKIKEELAKLQGAEKGDSGQSTSEQGTSDQGTSEQSTSQQGTSQQGTSQQGTSEQSPSEQALALKEFFGQLVSKEREPAFFTWREIFDIPPTWCDLSECRLAMLVCKNKPAGCHKHWRLVVIHECMLKIFDDEDEQSAIYIENKWREQYLATIAARKEGKDPILRSYAPKYKFRPTYKDIWTKLKSWYGFEICDENEPVPHQFAQFIDYDPFGNADPEKYMLYGNAALKEDFDEEEELAQRKREADEEMDDEEVEGDMEDEDDEEMDDEEEEDEEVEGEEEVEDEMEEQDQVEKEDQEKMASQEREEEGDAEEEKDQDMEKGEEGNKEEEKEENQGEEKAGNQEEKEEEHEEEEEEHDAEVAAGLEKESDE